MKRFFAIITILFILFIFGIIIALSLASEEHLEEFWFIYLGIFIIDLFLLAASKEIFNWVEKQLES